MTEYIFINEHDWSNYNNPEKMQGFTPKKFTSHSFNNTTWVFLGSK